MNQAFINASINGNLPILSNFDLSKISLNVKEKALLEACKYGKLNIVEYFLSRTDFSDLGNNQDS